ncbi:HTH_48 domain-containing protein [Trichonephila clavipes]|nr:HTH_48 domain-containing protein [Trichonephila clavipes]
MSATDIYRQITEVYGTETMSDNFRKRVRKFKDGRTNVHDEECSGRFSVIIYDLMQAVLKKFKLCSRWIPRLLTAEHKEKRIAISLDILIRYEEEGDDTLSRNVTRDETRVSHITPESKQQTMEWRHTSSPVKVKSIQTLSKRKIGNSVLGPAHSGQFSQSGAGKVRK